MNRLIIDLHAHPQLKPINSSEEKRDLKGIWGTFGESQLCGELNKYLRRSLNEIQRESQANFDQALAGNVNGVFLAMGPAERNFFKPHPQHILLKLILKRRDYRKLAACITGFDIDKVDRIFRRIENKKGVDYFNEELVQEYEFLTTEAAKSENREHKMVIAGDYEEFQKNIRDEKTVTSVLTIEGAHSLGNYAEDADFSRDIHEADQQALYNRLMPDFEQNIVAMKKWGSGRHTPFFITICHHFSNLLAGHAKSFSPRQGLLRPGMDDLLNQNAGKNEGFSRLGRDVTNLLLSKENGRRILIDVKHMSVKARLEFYRLLEEKYWSQGDEVPVICSHAALSGYETLEESDKRDTYRRWRNHYLSRQSINLSNEEARIIAQSNGLVGIVLHGGRLPGGLAKNRMENAPDDDWLRDESLRLVMSNIFHFVRVVGDKTAWDRLCIGSDMDGVIVPFKMYPNYTQLQNLAIHLFQFFTRPLDLDDIGMNKNQLKEYMYGFDAEELTGKLLSKNVLNFMQKYFHNGYLAKHDLVA
jgi:microsomal dipeptidase-like Zn-dependent dipeptidase